MNDYHHGDLPAALRSSTAQLVAERGPTGFSLREVARRAGVSHSAPAHHYGDSKGLLTAVAAEGFQRLSTAFDEATQGLTEPVEKLNAMGKAYLRVALDNPGHFGVMCVNELVDEDDETLAACSMEAYQKLLDVISEIAAALNPGLEINAAATMTWSAVHGLAVLAPTLGDVAEKFEAENPALDKLVDQFTEMMINGYAAR